MIRTFFATVALLAATAAHADAVLEYEGSNAACHADFQRLAVQGLSLRVDSASPQEDHSFVYDASEKTGFALDHRRKQFFEMEFDDDAIDYQGDVMKSTSTMVNRKMQQLPSGQPDSHCLSPGHPCPPAAAATTDARANAGSVMPQVDPKAVEAIMQQNMQHMSPEQQAKMREAIKNLSQFNGSGAARSEPVVEATGERREVNGISCVVERVTIDGRLLREDCRAPIDGIGFDSADLKRLQRAFARMQKFAGSIRDNLSIGGSKARHEMVDTRNVLVERRCFDAGKAAGSVSLRLRHDAPPSEWFGMPAGYTRMDIGMGGH